MGYVSRSSSTRGMSLPINVLRLTTYRLSLFTYGLLEKRKLA